MKSSAPGDSRGRELSLPHVIGHHLNAGETNGLWLPRERALIQSYAFRHMITHGYGPLRLEKPQRSKFPSDSNGL
jgi:hypothetical protein